ncbi:probable membrane-associated kinase regulator 1 [Actinidia eriantha]|uniref:probable membrane-associated kinase regulator 1 n=1 Tax=Actinidia eriantha TaxID=165200 RepID=UPI00258D5335|nr:probable membrane-associated kinase regulator 1 [Actinidia eriantha]
MGRRPENHPKSHTLPSSPTHSHSSSSSSSDFEFTVSLSPRKSSAALCPAEELFYKGQLLPLHLSPRLSMMRSLLSSSSSSRPSTDSHSSFSTFATESDSSRPSSATDDDEFHRLNPHHFNPQTKRSKYFSLSRFSSIFRVKDPKPGPDPDSGSSAKRVSFTAKDVIRKYLKKVKPLYEKISPKQRNASSISSISLSLIAKSDGSLPDRSDFSLRNARRENNVPLSHSFSGNLRFPRKRTVVSSCPSSMRSSPSHSGILSRSGFPDTGFSGRGGARYADASSMEELQSAIQGAIAHCKNSMIEKKNMVSNEI